MHHFWVSYFKKCHDLVNRVRGPSRSLEISPFDRAHMTSCWRSIVTGSILCHFWDIQCRIMSWPCNPGRRSLKVIGTDTYRSATYDFLLTFHGNPRTISDRLLDKQWFQLKIAILSHPRLFINAPAEFGTGAWVEKTRLMGLPDCRKSFRIGLII